MTRTFLRLAALTSLFVASVTTQAAPLALDFSGGQQFAPGVFHNIGWSFQVNSSVTVNSLGVFDVGADGLSERHQVGIWDSSNNLLAQTTVFSGATAVASASSLGQWLFQDIAALTLGPGTYVIGAFYSTSADTVIGNATGLTLDSNLSYLASRAGSGGSFDQPGVYGLVEPGVFGPNMQLEAAAVPEPNMLALLAIATAAGAFARRRPAKR